MCKYSNPELGGNSVKNCCFAVLVNHISWEKTIKVRPLKASVTGE